MAEGTTALDTDGLAEVTWEIATTLSGTPSLAASPQDAKSRGMALAIKRADQPLDLGSTSFHLYLAWRHLQTHARGLVPFETIDASKGSFRIFWPAAMASDEGSAECEIVLSWDKRTLSSPAFEVSVGTALLGTLAIEDGFTLFADVIKKYEKATTDALGIAAELAAAKDAGEFDGRDGTDGKDGINGADGKDGVNGKDGKDGAPGTKGEKGDTGPAGPKGADGVSCTHSWSGTVLTITSASGTSSADLRGPKGDQGPAGSGGTQDLSAYATKEWVSGQIPDLTSYATKDWTTQQIPDLSTYATQSWVTQKLPDLAPYATKEWVAQQFPDLSGVSY
jgi:hypothetical protein